jgi:hypothetical protein
MVHARVLATTAKRVNVAADNDGDHVVRSVPARKPGMTCYVISTAMGKNLGNYMISFPMTTTIRRSESHGGTKDIGSRIWV